MAGGCRWGLKLVAAALVFVVAGCSSGPGPATASAAFDEWGSDANGGGVAFVRLVDGTARLLATGDDAASGEPLDPQDRVRVGSISKVFAAVMVMQLVDEGLVDLDADVSDYVENLPVGASVTVRQLLAHRSGIPNYTDTEAFAALITDGLDRTPSPTDMLDLVAGESDFDPGARFDYSNSNYIVLGMLVEKLDERPLDDALAARIATPLGLSRTGFDDGEFTDVAAGSSRFILGGTTASRSYRSIALSAWAAGGMVTTVGELATFLDALFFDDLVSADSLEEMVRGLGGGADDGLGSDYWADDGLGVDYGLGLHAGPDFGVGHRGSIIGFNSLAEIDPVTGEMIIVVVNKDWLNPAEASLAIWKAIRAG